MAGDVWLSKQAHWGANSSLYHWVLDFLIAGVDDPGAVADLEEIRDANLGLVNLEDFDLKVQRRRQLCYCDEQVTGIIVALHQWVLPQKGDRPRHQCFHANLLADEQAKILGCEGMHRFAP
jgi:hypothetical protein